MLELVTNRDFSIIALCFSLLSFLFSLCFFILAIIVVNKSSGSQEKANSIASWALGISIISLICSTIIPIHVNNRTIKVTEKVNSKEYQIAENTKFDLLELLCVLVSIDGKIASNNEDFSQEATMLHRIQANTNYLFMLHSIERKERESMARRVLELEGLLSQTSPNADRIKVQIDSIKTIFNNHKDLINSGINIKSVCSSLLDDFCSMNESDTVDNIIPVLKQ